MQKRGKENNCIRFIGLESVHRESVFMGIDGHREQRKLMSGSKNLRRGVSDVKEWVGGRLGRQHTLMAVQKTNRQKRSKSLELVFFPGKVHQIHEV